MGPPVFNGTELGPLISAGCQLQRIILTIWSSYAIEIRWKWWCKGIHSIPENSNRYLTTGRKPDVWRKLNRYFFPHWAARTTWTQGETITWIFHEINLVLSFWPRPAGRRENSVAEPERRLKARIGRGRYVSSVLSSHWYSGFIFPWCVLSAH